ncbi:putative serine/threonine-protein kinase-like protein CCR3 [Panicum miliaceum]|uniref:non-specific serine/threonine protein kinase n=1 Tax=Panicum miliaceum TaxID=4540 RepID=A0A3L6SWF8_PANMI|nr:putative serine/threonine-protein kinase-like protein CCR3 [Panicum miliaceum]
METSTRDGTKDETPRLARKKPRGGGGGDGDGDAVPVSLRPRPTPPARVAVSPPFAFFPRGRFGPPRPFSPVPAPRHLADDGRRRLLPMTPLPSLLLLVLIAAAPSPAPASAATLAVSGGGASPVVCGVAKENRTLVCAPASGGSASSNASAVAPFLTFAEVSAGRGFVCGLQEGGAALFCWPPAAAPRWDQLRRVYNGPGALTDLAVGADHVAAYDAAARRVLWWRGVGRFPLQANGSFRSLVSGDGFSCALEANASAAVRCWGPRGSAVQAAFANATSVRYLAAGGARACGGLASGAVLCPGSDSANAAANASAALPGELYPYGLAVGDSHACGLLRPNRTAVCWSLGGPTTTLYFPAAGTGTRFQFLVAGGNLTCGVVSFDFSVMCWSLDSVASHVPLPRILPGVCVRDESSCGGCGFMAQSQQFCGGSGGICDSLCDDSPAPPPRTPVPPPPSSPPPPGSSSKRVSKAWIAFCVVGAVGGFAGLCSIVYCLVFGFCSNKRVHNSVQPNITTTAGAAADNNNNNGGGAAGSPYGSPNGSRARGLFRRQLSRGNAGGDRGGGGFGNSSSSASLSVTSMDRSGALV